MIFYGQVRVVAGQGEIMPQMLPHAIIGAKPTRMEQLLGIPPLEHPLPLTNRIFPVEVFLGSIFPSQCLSLQPKMELQPQSFLMKLEIVGR